MKGSAGGTEPTPEQVRDMARHVDHEMSRLLWIGETLRRLAIPLPDTVVRALRVAYAAHARVLLEFFHDGRPGNLGRRKTHGGDMDICLCDYTGKAAGAHSWSPANQQRLDDADKLLGHLSTGRLDPARGSLPEWGDREDRGRFREAIQRIMTEVQDPTRFPETTRALAEIEAG